MEGKKNLCAMIPAELHAKIMAEKEQLELNTLAEYVERIFTEHFEGGQISMKAERTLAVQIPAELFERLKAYLKKNNLKQKQFIIGLIEDALEQDEEDTTAQAGSENASETEEPDEPDMDAEEE